MKLSSGQGAAPFRRGGDKKALECGNAANFSKEAIHMKKILKRNLSVLLAVFMLLMQTALLMKQPLMRSMFLMIIKLSPIIF